MTLLKRDAILKAQDNETKDVEVKEWGGTVRVRHMTLAERSEFLRRCGSEDKTIVASWLMVTLCVDESGSPLFTPEDIPELEKKNFRAVEAVGQAILDINKIGEKKVEEEEKN
jgi:hypothetical protein